MSQKKNGGFALILIVTFLPVAIAGVLTIFAIIQFSQVDLALKFECRKGGLDGQKKVAPLLANLLSLNKTALVLRLRKIKQLEALATATASANSVAIAIASERLAKVMRQSEELDIKQKQIIQHSNIILNNFFERTQFKISNEGRRIRNPLLNVQLKSVLGKAPHLAVHPDDTDIAPTYSLHSDFQTQQALAHEWQYRIGIKYPFSQFIRGEFIFKKACAVSLENREGSWKANLTKGKFLLKSVW